jgi:Ca2+-binding EF-hand superfamily protein
MPVDETRLTEIFQNKNSITFEEFCGIMQSFGQHEHDAYFDETFRAFDRNSDGYITAKEIKKTMKDLGEPLTDKQAKEMLKTADANRDGKLSQDEFRTLFNYLTQQTTTPPISPSPTTPNGENQQRFSNSFKSETQ